jgi:hypothetical protein
MPANIVLIERMYELPTGTIRMILVDNDTDAVYYAAGQQSYLYRSTIIDARYLFIPVMEAV